MHRKAANLLENVGETIEIVVDSFATQIDIPGWSGELACFSNGMGKKE